MNTLCFFAKSREGALYSLLISMIQHSEFFIKQSYHHAILNTSTSLTAFYSLSENTFENSYHIETSQLNFHANQLTGFYMIQVFSQWNFKKSKSFMEAKEASTKCCSLKWLLCTCDLHS